MGTFADRLREEIEYLGLTRKELAYKANVKQRALDMYLGTQATIPPADVAVRLAKVLNVTVEYLVTGENTTSPDVTEKQKHEQRIIKIQQDLEKCTEETRQFIEKTAHLFAEQEKNS